MNCKPGDLAIRTKAWADSFIPVGAIVRCVSFDPTPSLLVPDWAGSNTEFGTLVSGTWEVEWNGRQDAFGIPLAIPDEHLRPVRDNDGEDETLQWAPMRDLFEEAA